MKTTPMSQQLQRQRKFLVMLPLITLPFLTLLFWALGGGKVDPAKAKALTPKSFNMNLPDAKLKDDKGLDKMSFYSKAAADSARLRQQMKADPYSRSRSDLTAPAGPAVALFATRKTAGLSSGSLSADPAANEDRIYKQLAQLQAVLNKPAPADPAPGYTSGMTLATKTKSIQSPGAEDPEMKQMNGLLEKVLEIQHPERTKQNEADKKFTPEKQFQAIPAIVDGNQKVTNGTVVRIKLLDTATINGQLIPKGQLIYGAANLYNQRLTMTIKNIGLGNTILPVDLTVFDQKDALEGISVPEAVTGDAVKDGAANGVQGMELMSLDESMSAQAATAGINTAKSLFSKKIRRVKGKLKDGHPLLLRDNKRLNK